MIMNRDKKAVAGFFFSFYYYVNVGPPEETDV